MAKTQMKKIVLIIRPAGYTAPGINTQPKRQQGFGFFKGLRQWYNENVTFHRFANAAATAHEKPSESNMRKMETARQQFVKAQEARNNKQQ